MKVRCDLLKIYYLCGSNNSFMSVEIGIRSVVICLKFTTFVVATTVKFDITKFFSCCDLLKIYYLCGSNNSVLDLRYAQALVVICLKFTTFVVATTVTIL